jgi:hypothetical protein
MKTENRKRFPCFIRSPAKRIVRQLEAAEYEVEL